MTRSLKELIHLLQREDPEYFSKILSEIPYRIRHDDLIVRPGELDELFKIILYSAEKGIIKPRELRNIARDLAMHLNRSEQVSSFELERFVRRLSRYTNLEYDKDFIEDGEPKNQEKEKLENQKRVFQSISNISLAEKDKILFFVGAGASKPEPSNIPTINELLPELWKKSDRMETKPLEKLQRWCEDNRIKDIEEMLTAVTISNFIIKNSKVHGLLNSVLYPDSSIMKEISLRDIDAVLLLDNMLNTFFSLLVGTMLKAKPNEIHKSIAKFTKHYKFVDIITTNYDTCLDLALDEVNMKYNYILNASEVPNSTKLVKMHGSINWFYCETCQNEFLPDIKTVLEAIDKKIPYAVLGMCQTCSAPVKQFIIPPITYKYLTHPPIVQVWDTGREILENARIVIVVGFSFSSADDYISKMLVNAVGQDPMKKIIMVDIDEKSIQRCKTFIKSHVENFDDNKNFLPLNGNGITIIPKLIDALKRSEASEKEDKKGDDQKEVVN